MKTTREKIIEESLKRFLTQGYDRTSLREVAESVNITKPAIYHYFRDKKELLLAVQRFLLKNVDRQYQHLTEQEISLEEMLDYLFASVKNVQPMFQELTGFETGKFNYHRFFFDCVEIDGAQLVEESYRDHKRLLSSKIREAQERNQVSINIDADSLAFTIIAMLEGTYLLSLYLPSLTIETMTQKMLSNVKMMLLTNGSTNPEF